MKACKTQKDTQGHFLSVINDSLLKTSILIDYCLVVSSRGLATVSGDGFWIHLGFLWAS